MAVSEPPDDDDAHQDNSSCSSTDQQQVAQDIDMIVAVGTYDGSIAAFEVVENGTRLKLILASPVHEGSVRSLAFSHHPNPSSRSCIMVSTGYDDVIKPHDFSTRRLSTGDIRTTSIVGTPTVAAFAPPPGKISSTASTHCLVGFGEPAGQLVLYKRNAKWTAQHILNGHEGGISALAVHPSGKLAITCGRRDGKLKVWDLERGRLAYASAHASRLQNTTHDGTNTTKHYECIDCIVWRPDEAAECYAFSYGSHITVRTTLTGKDLLDVDLPAKVNEVCLMDGPDGLFVVAACNDGSLPVLLVEEEGDSRRAIMAMEPSDGNERFKFIRHVSEYRVVVGSSTGVVHLMDLRGAAKMILNPEDDAEEDDEERDSARSTTDRNAESEEEEELAIEILDAKMVGSGARITSLAVWIASEEVIEKSPEHQQEEQAQHAQPKDSKTLMSDNKRKADVELDDAALEKARSLVSKAKRIQKKRNKRKNKSN